MTTMPDEPVVVVYIFTNSEGKKDFKMATNVSGNTKVILCDSQEDFDLHRQGKPFWNME